MTLAGDFVRSMEFLSRCRRAFISLAVPLFCVIALSIIATILPLAVGAASKYWNSFRAQSGSGGFFYADAWLHAASMGFLVALAYFNLDRVSEHKARFFREKRYVAKQHVREFLRRSDLPPYIEMNGHKRLSPLYNNYRAYFLLYVAGSPPRVSGWRRIWYFLRRQFDAPLLHYFSTPTDRAATQVISTSSFAVSVALGSEIIFDRSFDFGLTSALVLIQIVGLFYLIIGIVIAHRAASFDALCSDYERDVDNTVKFFQSALKGEFNDGSGHQWAPVAIRHSGGHDDKASSSRQK